ncbi:MAG: hypothetical protein H0V95_13750 [Actinobacteria bacterium]|nr:hypothetical protein [Actinomycetota bacterium]
MRVTRLRVAGHDDFGSDASGKFGPAAHIVSVQVRIESGDDTHADAIGKLEMAVDVAWRVDGHRDTLARDQV